MKDCTHPRDLIRRYTLQRSHLLSNHLHNLISHITLNNNFLLSLRCLAYATTGSKFPCELFGSLFEVDAEQFEVLDMCLVLALRAFRALNDDLFKGMNIRSIYAGIQKGCLIPWSVPSFWLRLQPS